MSDLVYQSSKTYAHSVGLSCCFRQWRAAGHSHCSFLHGYALSVKLMFESPTLDKRNWVQDFGGLKEVKKFLEQTFDHATVVARDDPEYDTFVMLDAKGIIRLVVLPHVGCEKFAEYIYREIIARWPEIGEALVAVEVREHEGNAAMVYRRDLPSSFGAKE